MTTFGINWPAEPMGALWFFGLSVWTLVFGFNVWLFTRALGLRNVRMLLAAGSFDRPYLVMAKVLTGVLLIGVVVFSAAEAFGAVRILSYWLNF